MTDDEDVRFVTRMAEREEEAARWYQHGGIHAEVAAKLRRVLARLEAAETALAVMAMEPAIDAARRAGEGEGRGA